MYTTNLERALNAFDDTLDSIATGKYVCPITHNTGWGTTEITISTPKLSCKFWNDNILDEIDRVIFNDPATVIIFKDGSKVQVKACKKDPFSKENGIRNALLKRAFANDVDENGYMTSRGLGEKIEKILREKSVDQKEVAARKAKEKAEKNAKKKADAKKSEKVDNKKTTSKKTK